METKSINQNKNIKVLLPINCNMVKETDNKKNILHDKEILETSGNICKHCFKEYKTRTGLWKHLKKCNTNIFAPKQKSIKSINKMETQFLCEICNYATNIKCNYMKHLSAKKHIKKINEKKEQESKKNSSVGFDINEISKITETADLIKMFSAYVKNNEQVQKELIESNERLIKEIIPNIGNNNNNTNNNISINVFLNEHCKNAISFEDFIKSMSITIEDVIKTNELGYINGVSNIFMKHLQTLDTKKRPIHCTDNKRMQFFIKEENTWEKDNGEKMEQAINVVSNKQLKEVKKLENKNKSYFEKEQEQYFSFMSNIMGPLEEEERKRQAKEILKNVGKGVSLKNAMVDNIMIEF